MEALEGRKRKEFLNGHNSATVKQWPVDVTFWPTLRPARNESQTADKSWVFQIGACFQCFHLVLTWGQADERTGKLGRSDHTWAEKGSVLFSTSQALWGRTFLQWPRHSFAQPCTKVPSIRVLPSIYCGIVAHWIETPDIVLTACLLRSFWPCQSIHNHGPIRLPGPDMWWADMS